MYVPGDVVPRPGMSDTLDMELQVVVNFQVGAGNWAQSSSPLEEEPVLSVTASILWPPIILSPSNPSTT